MTANRTNNAKSVLLNAVVPAGGTIPFPLTGEYVHIVASSQNAVGIGLDGEAPQYSLLGETLRMPVGGQFSRVLVENRSGTDDLTITLVYGVGLFELNQVKFSVPSTLETSTDVTLATGVAAQILASNANRRKAIIKSLNANTVDIRIGDASVAADKGYQLMPGEEREIEVTSSIWGFNNAPGDQVVSVLEVSE